MAALTNGDGMWRLDRLAGEPAFEVSPNVAFTVSFGEVAIAGRQGIATYAGLVLTRVPFAGLPAGSPRVPAGLPPASRPRPPLVVVSGGPGVDARAPRAGLAESVAMPDDYFGDRVAARYDESAADMFAPEIVDPAVDFLACLADGGAALEFGVGTGRIALPLHARGVPVHGIDLSAAMVAKLREKPGADAIGVTVGDFATTVVGGEFRLAYLVFNTIMNLTTQDEQVACFANAARHLEPGGFFAVEVSVPRLRLLPPGERFQPFTVTAERLGIDEYDVVNQGLVSHHYRVEDGRLDVNSVPFRYVWPAELDLMARLAGMSPYERWGGWKREPFTAASHSHVSVWRTPRGAP